MLKVSELEIDLLIIIKTEGETETSAEVWNSARRGDLEVARGANRGTERDKFSLKSQNAPQKTLK